MKPISVSRVITIVIALLFCTFSQAQTIGISSSAVWISDCNQDNYFNTSGLIGPAGNMFSNNNFGTHTRNSGTLVLRGGEVRTFQTPGASNVCSTRLHYRVYPQASVPGPFISIDLAFEGDCNISSNQFPSGGSCAAGDKKWNLVIADGATMPYTPIDLTTLPPGNYELEIYYDITGSSTSTSLCDETIVFNNGGTDYKAFFTIQAPLLASANPTTCNGSEGFITISDLTPGVTYVVSYSDDGNPVGPTNLIADGSGQIIIPGLNAGVYSDFEIGVNGCTTNLNTGVILSNPVIIPKFNKIAAFCEGMAAPVLPATSLNGLTGTWSPAVISNTTSGSYTFTPNANQCGLPITINVTVNTKATPVFAFGTSLAICPGESVPFLPSTSTNGIAGSWSPSVISNTTSATYTFTPSVGQCANGTTLTVTVNPNITPAFSFGTSLTICAGETVPTLPATSDNGITGTWSAPAVDNQNPAVYTFTPTAGQCATSTNFNVTVNPVVPPTFSFGTSLDICAGGVVPNLPTTSSNGISGTWTPAIVDNQNSNTYTFTPDAGTCSPPVTFTVTVSSNITPTFSFGTSLTICEGGSTPVLPNTSDNGITGSWNPSTIDNGNSGIYTFTPDAGQCATAASFDVIVNQILIPTFSFGTNTTICAGAGVPSLPVISQNGITGTWSPSVIDNQNSSTYIFTPATGQCGTSTSFTVTVNPNTVPAFSFGSTLMICPGASVPILPASSDNGINGTWSPSIIDNRTSGIYTFTSSSGQCVVIEPLIVTVSPMVTPVFSFGNAQSICAGSTVPTLPNTSVNGITGTWNPATVDNQNSGIYTFTPDAGQCAVSTNFTVTAASNPMPVFDFGTSLIICAGSAIPSLPQTSLNGVSGTWNPATINDQASGVYTFTPLTGQCGNNTTLAVTVNQNTIPTFSFGTSLVICAGENIPTLPAISANGISGTWIPASVNNQASGVYTFTPDPVPGECFATTNFTVTVNQNITPSFSFGTSLTICAGSPAPLLPTTSNNAITGKWNPAIINNQISGSYIFTPDAGQCVSPDVVLEVKVTPLGTVDFESDTTVTDGTVIAGNSLFGGPSGVSFSWINTNTSIGLPASGTGNIPTFTATNKGSSLNKGTIVVTPVYNGCAGVAKSFVITVIPLDQGIFVPNVFSPNNDGKNEVLYAYGNYIEKLEMRIFNQWGQQVHMITDHHNGWDGKYKGTPQPVGVYMYIVKATMTDGRKIQLKGSNTLIR